MKNKVKAGWRREETMRTQSSIFCPFPFPLLHEWLVDFLSPSLLLWVFCCCFLLLLVVCFHSTSIHHPSKNLTSASGCYSSSFTPASQAGRQAAEREREGTSEERTMGSEERNAKEMPATRQEGDNTRRRHAPTNPARISPGRRRADRTMGRDDGKWHEESKMTTQDTLITKTNRNDKNMLGTKMQ